MALWGDKWKKLYELTPKFHLDYSAGQARPMIVVLLIAGMLLF
jgi:hypothetical protein